MFVHLQNHSHYSILEGLPKPVDYVKKAKELGMKAVALTDTGNLHGGHEFYKACKSEGIIPILGVELFVNSLIDNKINHKLVLLAKSLSGYQNIISLVSKANLDSETTIPCITLDYLIEFQKTKEKLDIICLSGPINGEIPFFILSGKSNDEILERIKFYQNIFGKEDYYVELLYHDDIPKQKFVTDKLIEIYNENPGFFKVVAANNSYYINKEDKVTQDVIKALGTGHEIENPDRPTLINGDYSFLDENEMQKIFGFIPEALNNTVEIADKINIDIKTGGILIPRFDLPEEDKLIYNNAIKNEELLYKEEKIKKLSSDEWYLRYLSFKGLNWRFDYKLDDEIIFEFVKKLNKPKLDKNLTETSPQELKDLSLTYYTDRKKEILSTMSKKENEYIERLEYELVVVHEMGFDGYFLIVADYINWAKKQGIPVGPGRGSAAGSLMAYLSGITDLDPIFYDLLFERFLNPARVSMPDIDTDFADDERDKVVEYCRHKYGQDKVAQICTFGTFAARAAVKDVGRVNGVSFSEMNDLAKLIPSKPGTKLASALKDSPEFKDAYDNNKKYKAIIDNALKIEGNVRQIGVHACAVIIAPEPMTNFTALAHPPKDFNSIITQYSAYPLEDLGLLKMDFLGLRNLTIIKRTLKIIKNNGGQDIDILNLDMKDEGVFDIFSAGDTTGIFQFESDGMRKYLKDLKPDSFDDLIAMVSLYRPGPIAYIPTYIDRKYGREEIKYMTEDLTNILLKSKCSKKIIKEQKQKLEEDLKKILDVTNGIAVYQEQLMFIVQYMAGFSLGEADLLRRGIGKKKVEIIEKLKIEFIEKSETFRGYRKEVSKYIYEEMIQPAANYSFNKSHAACYAFISYQTAYLKAHYQTEFLTSIMVSDEENMDRIVMEVSECELKGISVLPPSVNESLKHFTYIDKTTIRFGLKAIKGIGDGPIDRIIQVREKIGGKFKDLRHFIEECGKEVINKKSLESLILSGAMDDLGLRKQMFISISEIIQFVKKDEKKKETNQIGLFDMGCSDFEDELKLKETKEYSFEEKLKGEKEVIGFYVSGHPLDGLQRYCQRRSNNTKKLKMSFEELEEIDKKENPEKYEKVEDDEKKSKKSPQNKKKKDELVQAVGIINSLRKIITKTGNTIIILFCEGFDYDFEVVFFQKDIEKYGDKIKEDKILIVSGLLNVNFEYKRKSIQARDAKFATISQVREQAKDLNLFNDKKRYINIDLNTSKEDELDNNISIDSSFKEEDKIIKDYVIDIPKNAKKLDLHDLKDFLSKQKSGSIKVFINLNGKKIDTKFSINDVKLLEKWVNKKWN
ncbi:DNA polymerase III subunit alpha [Candidatus Gracilibacteria bacterium]|nr:MAG: DNA polymerase III subunit alpha [Candidatus Gracilibacteria bacterium]PIE85586.1 MAG: DNA polymerase III subunit alpha [Candidatus Gracilibacteria bacterium]